MLDKLDKMKINKESSDSDIQECIDLGLGSIGLMAQYNRLTNLKRKEVHRPDLEHDYHHLCSPNVAFTDMLYGDDISKNVKEIQDVNRDGNTIGKFPVSNFGGRSYYRGCSSIGAEVVEVPELEAVVVLVPEVVIVDEALLYTINSQKTSMFLSRKGMSDI